jgi:hypothetical protein
MAFSHDFLDQLEAAVLARQGRPEQDEIKFLCPGHDDHNASAGWNTIKHVWHCFVCGAGGGAFDLAKRLGVDRPVDPAAGYPCRILLSWSCRPTSCVRSG